MIQLEQKKAFTQRRDVLPFKEEGSQGIEVEMQVGSNVGK